MSKFRNMVPTRRRNKDELEEDSFSVNRNRKQQQRDQVRRIDKRLKNALRARNPHELVELEEESY